MVVSLVIPIRCNSILLVLVWCNFNLFEGTPQTLNYTYCNPTRWSSTIHKEKWLKWDGEVPKVVVERYWYSKLRTHGNLTACSWWNQKQISRGWRNSAGSRFKEFYYRASKLVTKYFWFSNYIRRYVTLSNLPFHVNIINFVNIENISLCY